ncbi:MULTISPECIES: hypothetical protein [Ruminococcus]|uniref:hypothetical protein n=2 Tax=Oscillospiraceae TaxID=216572 RepID=UPI0025DF1A69|nr:MULTISPECIES: hypothetical protein [Ruminococcus]
MRKHSKFITILLSAVLAVCLVQTVFVQAFATENSATPDEPTEDLYPVSMEVVKAPESVTDIDNSTFWSNVVLHIVYSNGEEYDVNCDGVFNEGGIVPPIAEIKGYAGRITADYYSLTGDATASFKVDYCYGYDYYISAIFSVEMTHPVSMEVVKAPESVTVNKGRITDSTFWSNVVLHIVYSNGEEYDVKCDGIDSEGGIVPPIAEFDGYRGSITVDYHCRDNTVDFTVDYCYASYTWDKNTISADYSVKQVADPHSITRLEVTKLPDMVFTKPLFTGSRDDISTEEEWDEWMKSLDVNNSISNHIDGMEITYYYANGEKRSVVVNSSNLKMIAAMPWFALYRVENDDEYGNNLYFAVTDEGDYKFSISLNSDGRDGTVYTAKSVDNPNPSIKPVSTEDTPAKPAKPSDNNGSSTSDTATNDSTNNNNGNGTQNNGVVATGDFATPAIIATVMILAAAVMFVLKRKHTF